MKQNLVIMPKRFHTWLAWCKNCSHFFELTAFYIWIDLCLTTKHLFEKLFSDFNFLLLLLLSNCPVIFFPEYGGPFKDIEKNLFIWLKRHSVIVYYFLVSSDFVVFLKIYILYMFSVLQRKAWNETGEKQHNNKIQKKSTASSFFVNIMWKLFCFFHGVIWCTKCILS